MRIVVRKCLTTEREAMRKRTKKVLQKKLFREQKRNNELNQLIKKIYEDNVSGKLTDKLKKNYNTSIVKTDYEFQKGDNKLLIISK